MGNGQRSSALLLALLFAVPAAASDLSVGWISREPKIPYVWASTNPTREGWPAEGQQVTWTAHVWNLGDAEEKDVAYRWSIDGVTAAEGTATLRQGETKLSLPWTWTFSRHQIAFQIDPGRRLTEGERRNNRLLIYTDALAVGLWVEQAFWDGIRPKLIFQGFGATTFADWMQLRILQYNSMAALAIYPETPQGVLDRWRIDEIHIVPDGALPLVTPGPEVRDWGAHPSDWGTLYPDSSDQTVDMEWGFPAFTLAFYANYELSSMFNNSVVHELGHARSLVDVYGWDITDPGDLVLLNQPRPPHDTNGNYLRTTEWGMMNTQWGFIDRYSAVVLNHFAGMRAREGNYNEPRDLGRFLNDLPEQNRVKLVTDRGTTFPNAEVKIYSASSRLDPDWESHPYQMVFDATPDQVLRTDADGTVLVGRNPFSDADLTVWVDRTNVTAIVQLFDGNFNRWAYLESKDFNMAYWRGDTELANYTVVLDAPLCAGPGGGLFSPVYEQIVTSPDVTFEFLAKTGYSYEVWWSLEGGTPQHIEVPVQDVFQHITRTVSIPEEGHVAWWVVEHNTRASELCPPAHTDIFYFNRQNVQGRPRGVRR